MAFVHCIARLKQAAGRDLSDAEIVGIYERVHKAALDIKAGRVTAVKGDQFDNVVQQAGKEAAAQLMAEAAKKQQQTHLQLTKMSARLRENKAMIEAGIKPLDAVDREVFRNFDGKTDVQSLEQLIIGKRSYYGIKLSEVIEGLGRGFWQDKTKTLNLVHEMLGEKTGDAVAGKAAKAWKGLTDEAHANLREAGGVVGKLDESYVPHGWWSQEMVARIVFPTRVGMNRPLAADACDQGVSPARVGIVRQATAGKIKRLRLVAPWKMRDGLPAPSIYPVA